MPPNIDSLRPPVGPNAQAEARTIEESKRKAALAEAGFRLAAQRKDETAMVSKLSEMVRAPTYLMDMFREMVADRAYVYRDCMLLDSQDAVAVNQVLRNQLISLAYLGVSDPKPLCQPAKRVGNTVGLGVDLFAQTAEIHLENVMNLMRFADKIEGAAQDASTNSYAVLKVTVQDDFMRDPIGKSRFGDMQEQVAEYERLKRLKLAGELPENSAEHLEFTDLEQTLRLFAAGAVEEQIKAVPMLVPQEQPVIDQFGQPMLNPNTLQPITRTVMVNDPQDPREMRRQAIIEGTEPIDILGMPQMPHYQGFVCDQILPEDFRWAWNITRPEDWLEAEWQAHRVYMAPEDIKAKWKMTDGEMAQATAPSAAGAKGPTGSNSTDQDPNMRTDLEASAINSTIAVWEVWHKKMFRRYVFIEGVNRILENTVPQAQGKRFYPFFPFGYNRVSGRVMPLSDVKLTRNLQDEINMLRTHDREARRASYPVLFIPKGVMEPQAIEMYRNRMPFSVIEVSRPEEIKKYLEESTTVPYNPILYSIDGPQQQIQQMFGIPMVMTGGGSNEDLASALALAKDGMDTGVGQRKIKINKVITDIMYWILEISLRIYPESYMKKTCGEQAVWPRMTTEELYTNLKVEVKGGLSGQPAAKERMALWQNFSAIARDLQLPVNGMEVLRELLDSMGIRMDFTKFLVPVVAPGTVQAGVPQDGGTGEAAPEPSMGAGPDGGAPLMADPQRGPPDSLEQIPNNPLARTGLA
jgi:hypothetical protein